jgi:lysozyme
MWLGGSMISTSTFSDLKADLIRDEGYKDKPYKDSQGFLTIGVGHNLDAEGLCPAAILAQLEYDINKAEKRLLRFSWYNNTLPSKVQRALLNLSFNLGDTLLDFHQTLSLIEHGEYSKAADQLMTNERYVKQVGKRAARIADLLRNP